MLNDSFRIRYKSVPVAIYEQKDSFGPTRLHNHNEFEILLIVSGSCRVRIANMQYSAHAGDIIFVNPLEIHEITVNTEAPYHHRCMCFEDSVIMNNRTGENLRSESISAEHLIKSSSPHNKHLAELFGKAFDAFTRDEKAMPMEVCAYITLMFSYLINNSLSDTGSRAASENGFCADVTRYIKDHYKEPVTSLGAAEACFLNQSYFCRKFKENFGISFSAYLNMYRISVAKGLLEDDSLTVTQVSEMCGFETPAYFSKCFRNHVGVLPAEYKKGQ